MAFLALVVIIGIVVFVVKSANKNTVGYAQRNNEPNTQGNPNEYSSDQFGMPSQTTLSEAEKASLVAEMSAKAMAASELLKEVLISNLECLPKSVLEMEYTKKAIQIFIYYYLCVIVLPQIQNPKIIGLIGRLVMGDLHAMGVMERSEFDSDLNRNMDPAFLTMPVLIKTFAPYPAKKQTALLVVIEKHMEAELGHKVRYIGQRPPDNPLNSKN